MSQVTYCKHWSQGRRCITDSITEAKACKRHNKREKYEVLIGGVDHPSVIILLVNGLVSVHHMDSLLRDPLVYQFQEEQPNRLLLSIAIRRVYPPATDAMIARMEAGRAKPDQPWAQFLADKVDKIIEGTSLVFKEVGSVLKQYEHFAEPYAYHEVKATYDASILWEPYPEFGCYDYLLKLRDLPWGTGIDDV